MSDGIHGFIIGDKEVVKRLSAMSNEAQSKVRAAIGRMTLRLQRKVMQEKLSGQVLSVRTGNLRRSIDGRVVNDGGATTGIVDTNLKYAAAREYGFQGTVTVREHLRRAKSGMVPVRSHSRRMNLPERSFLRSALRELQPDIVAAISAATGEAIKQ